MTRKRTLILKFAAVLILFTFIVCGNYKGTQTIYAADEPEVQTEEYKFYTTVASDLDIDEEGALQGFSEEFLARNEKHVALILPDSVKTIKAAAFAGHCEITTVELPSALPDIETTAFENCNGIVEVYDPHGVIEYDPGMTSSLHGSLLYYALSFRKNTADSNITIDDDGQVFCESNRGITSGRHYFVAYLGSDETLIMTEKEFNYDIYQYALWENETLTYVNADHSNAENIGNYAFHNCENLQYVVLPDTVKVIGHYAFQNSSKVSSVELNDRKSLPTNLVTIGDYAFANTGLSGEVVIPASVQEIGDSAFLASSIDALTFEESSQGEEAIDLTIKRNAFANCTKLVMVDFPARLHVLYARSFSGTGLSTVYIHSDVEYTGIPNLENTFFPNTTTIIYDTKELYDDAKNTLYINVHESQMTYLIHINFDCGNGSIVKTQGLYDRTFDFVKGGNGVWGTANADLRKTLIPTQEGYKYTIWFTSQDYSDETPLSNQDDDKINASIDRISSMLQNAIRDGIDEINLYARYISKPSVSAKSLTYDESTSYATPERWVELLSFEDSYVFDFGIMDLLLEGNVSISNAGDYTLIIALKETYGAWADNVNVVVTVDRKMVQLNSLITWTLNTGEGVSPLLSGTVYVYRNSSNDSIYSFTLLQAEQLPEGYSLYSTLNVENSIVRARKDEVEISLNESDKFSIYYSGLNFTFEGDPEDLGQNKGTENNIYTAKAIIKANPNYAFRSTGDVDTITNSSRGLTIDISEDRTEARVSKVWYILEVSNTLFVKGSSDKDYTIQNWKYNTSTTIDIPVMEHSNPSDSLTFSLSRDNQTIVEEVPVEGQTRGLTYYVNESMPAGSYALIIHIPNVEIDGIKYFGYNATYNFEVELADFLDAWKEDAKAKLKDVEWQYAEKDDEGIVQVYHHSDYNASHEDTINDHSVDLKVWSDFLGENASKLNPTRTGYWALEEADEYYSSRFSLTYNLARMQQSRYSTYTELESTSSSFSPKRVDDYTVYYQIKANNYQPLVNELDDTERRVWKFEVTIFDVLPIPTITQELSYNGNPIYPIIAANDHYSVEYNDEEYISAKKHTITLISTDSTHYRWAVDNLDREYTLEFNIEKAKNNWLQNPNILSWEFDGFDPQNNLIFAEARYGETITFAITKDEAGKEVVEGLGNFTTKDGVVADDTVIALIKKLPAVSTYYYLFASVKTDNVEDLSSSTRFQVFKTQNTWETTPNVMQWKYGGYDKNTNLVLAQAKIKDDNNPTTFTVSTDKEGKHPVLGLENFTSVNGVVSDEVANVLSGLTTNTYYLFAKVNETDSYAAMTPEPLAFEVSIASNYWDVMPTISTWVQGSYDVEENVILATSHFGDEIHIVITLAGNKDKVVYDNLNGINDLAKAKVGVYELTAYVNATENYSELSSSFTFQIFKKPGMPWWGTLLIVVGALALVALVLFILHQHGVLQLLSGKIVIAMRTKATVDATIAAVRANKVAEEAKRTVALAKQKELAEARKKALAEFRKKPLEERAAVLDERAKENAQRAEKLQKKADSMQIKADRMLERANRKGNLNSDDSENKE